jgi:hypothetical protein
LRGYSNFRGISLRGGDIEKKNYEGNLWYLNINIEKYGAELYCFKIQTKIYPSRHEKN